jgi:hypothetical protein
VWQWGPASPASAVRSLISVDSFEPVEGTLHAPIAIIERQLEARKILSIAFMTLTPK